MLVQLSDLHIVEAGTTIHGIDTAENLRQVGAALAAMDLQPAAVILTGDLTNDGEPASYRHLRDLVRDVLEPMGAPIHPVLGNHDARGPFHECFREVAATTESFYYRADLPGLRLLMCDSHHPGHYTGLLGDEQLAWIDRELDGVDEQRPAVLALHHPSVPRGVPRPDDFLLADRAELEDVLRGRAVAAVLCGHSHVATASTFGGALHAAAPATAFLLDPSRRGSNRAYAGAGLAICTVRDGRAIVNPYVLPMDGPELHLA